MIPYPNIDPVLVQIGPLAVRWYGLMYVAGFAASYLLVVYQITKKGVGIARAKIDDLYFYLILGLLIGARLGYVIFYNLGFYVEHPLEVAVLWHGGMSFHGGLLGAFVAGYIVIKRKRMDFWKVADLVIVTAPIGIGLGRLGNFINGELFGKPTDLPWAMIFPGGGNLPRHPSQLYEALLEGLFLFIVLWLYKDRKERDGDLFALFLILYAIFRVFCEFFREPDLQMGYMFGFVTMGQLLSVAMLLIGFLLKYGFVRKRPLLPKS